MTTPVGLVTGAWMAITQLRNWNALLRMAPAGQLVMACIWTATGQTGGGLLAATHFINLQKVHGEKKSFCYQRLSFL
jgi:hypothetical protein